MDHLSYPNAFVIGLAIVAACYVIGLLLNIDREPLIPVRERVPYQEPLYTSITVPSGTNLEDFLKSQIRITEEQLRFNSDLGNIEQITILNQALSLYKNMLTLHQKKEDANNN